MEKEEEPKIDVQNKKGFTLVELLAVIAIIAVLMIVAIPAVTNTVASSKKSTYATNAKKFIDAVRLGLTNGDLKKDGSGTCQFPDPGEYIVVDLSTVYVEKGGEKSSFNQDYDKHYVIVANEGTVSSGDKIVYYYAGSDKGKNGIENFTKEDEITKSKIKVGNAKADYTSSLNSFNGYRRESYCHGNKDENYVPGEEADNDPAADIKFVNAYQFSDSCISGGENTCVPTNCYKKTESKCPIGTIIEYKVNPTKTVRFHVLIDNGTTIRMQSQNNTVSDVRWFHNAVNQRDPATYTSYNRNGPMEALGNLDLATADWSNVNTLNYTLGKSDFNTGNSKTGCSEINNCSTNTYNTQERTGKARLLTVQELYGFCPNEAVCPVWMYTCLSGSENLSYCGGQASSTYGYWLMNAVSNSTDTAWAMFGKGKTRTYSTKDSLAVRAVVEVDKE